MLYRICGADRLLVLSENFCTRVSRNSFESYKPANDGSNRGPRRACSRSLCRSQWFCQFVWVWVCTSKLFVAALKVNADTIFILKHPYTYICCNLLEVDELKSSSEIRLTTCVTCRACFVYEMWRTYTCRQTCRSKVLWRILHENLKRTDKECVHNAKLRVNHTMPFDAMRSSLLARGMHGELPQPLHKSPPLELTLCTHNHHLQRRIAALHLFLAYNYFHRTTRTLPPKNTAPVRELLVSRRVDRVYVSVFCKRARHAAVFNFCWFACLVR